jgi:hypothetical protein
MKNKHIQKVLILLSIIYSNFCIAQNINNNLYGYYEAISEQTSYSSFEFDGNGKVSIAGMDFRDYFTKGDTLVIYPDKSIFKFKIEKNKLIGASTWVENGVWIKKDTLIPNNRKDDAKANNIAVLMNEYYQISGDKTSFDFLGDDAKASAQKDMMNKLCNKGLSRACLDYFGMLVIEDQGMGVLFNLEKQTKPVPENSNIIALGNKIIIEGEPQGHAVLGSYYYMIGKKGKRRYEIGNSTF